MNTIHILAYVARAKGRGEGVESGGEQNGNIPSFFSIKCLLLFNIFCTFLMIECPFFPDSFNSNAIVFV